MFYTKILVRKHERGLLYKDRDYQQFLEPGVYSFFDPRSRYTFELFDMAKPAFSHSLIDYFVTNESEQLSRMFDIVETGQDEAALVFHNERARELLGPSERRFYWKGLVTTRVERFDLSLSGKIDNRMARQIFDTKNANVVKRAGDAVSVFVVPDGHEGMLYVDGVITETLAAGTHAFWRYQNDVSVELIDMRVRTLEVTGQEILTRDKVNLRINLTAVFRFTDALKATRSAKDPLDHLYKEIQFGLRAAVGTRTLDALLEDKSAIDRVVVEWLGEAFSQIGIQVRSIGVKDIILPGDMKEMLGKVVEAEKIAQANVIRRREETNATRSLLNTAKVMESNQVALRLKELETLEKVTEKVGSLSVYGGLDGVLNGLVQLKQ
ncbi:MAG: slipin family protein [Gammaproteobacteria bacterium]